MKLALIQTRTCWHDAAANRALFDEWFAKVAADTNLVILPEMFSTGFTMRPLEVAESMQGPTVAWMRAAAKKLDAVVTGSVVIGENGRHFNRMLWVTPDGGVTVYDKRHRFRMAGEHEHYAAGDARVVVRLGDWRICLMVCYDLRFPVWFRNRGDYDALICVANWPAARQTAWDALLRARAVENQCFAIGVNRVGVDGNDVAYCGGSGGYDFLGEPMARMVDEPGVIELVIDKQKLDVYRGAFPAWQDADDFVLKA
ncbi:MAG: amidohydrolase [Gammaproteobacteria bacterium]|nr:amidohydrolase [Gammaproteobacteria bacterium]